MGISYHLCGFKIATTYPFYTENFESEFMLFRLQKSVATETNKEDL